MSAALDYKSPLEIVETFLTSAPIDLSGMADALGLTVIETPDWQNDASGSIERSRSGFIIKINAEHSATRKRFTLAHEMAHYILHRDLIGDGITDDAMYRSGCPNSIETEANQYAAGLLMPARLMREAWKQGIRSYAEMANRFGVSSKAAEIRMRELFG
jgi:Zn-dependent peptidase ImmA (M78 family)